MSEEKHYYWLKLKKDFFKRHDIKIVESMSNGKDYILFYLKLLVESVDHLGELRFSKTIPYNDAMLSTITNTDIDKVRNAMKVFTELGMIEVLDDETIFMAEVAGMLGHESYWADIKRKQRLKSGQCPQLVQDVQVMSKQEIDIELDKDIELEKDLSVPEKPMTKKFVPPSLQEVTDYCNERQNGVDPSKWHNHYTSNGWKVGKNPMKDWKAAVRTWENNDKQKTASVRYNDL